MSHGNVQTCNYIRNSIEVNSNKAKNILYPVKLTLKIHRSLREINEPEKINADVEGILIDAIKEMISPYQEIYNQLFDSNKRRPGILYISNQLELSSLGLLEEEIDEDMEIKIVPVLHGG